MSQNVCEFCKNQFDERNAFFTGKNFNVALFTTLLSNTQTHTHTHTHIYIYIYIIRYRR
jgi:hypothetical protein